MPDIPNRSSLEADLARRFSKLSSTHRKQLLDLLGDPPNIGNVPQSFWEGVVSELNGSLVPFLAEVYMDSAERLVSDLPIGVDWGLVNQHAVVWAREYSYGLVRGITTTTQRAVQDAMSSFFAQGQTRADLEATLTRIFGPVRASAIAVTEVTRAATQGERSIAQEIADMGIDMTPIFQTSQDELVCPICGPMQGKVIESEEDYPPLHPNCRCWTNHELPKVKHG